MDHPRPTITVNDLSIRYPGANANALSEVHLALYPGVRTVLLGANGAGKSTLLRILAGVQPCPPQCVESQSNLGSVGSLPWRRQVAMMFQDHALIPRHTALWHVLQGRLGSLPWWGNWLPWSTADVNHAFAALRRVGLQGFAMRRIRDMSGGQRQRVGLARVLVQQSQVIFADEPIASLDPGTARTVLDILGDVCVREQRCVVVSLHQVDLARQWGQRIIAMDQGRICFDGPPDQCSDEIIEKLYSTHSPKQPQPQIPEIPCPQLA